MKKNNKKKFNYKILIFILIIFIIGIIIFILNNNKIELESCSYNYNGTDFVKISSDEVNNKLDSNYILFTYNSFCSFKIPCDSIFKEYMTNNKILIYSIPFSEFKNTYLYSKVKYAPSVIIISSGKVIAYLDANSDSDLDNYQDINKFTKWINKYIRVS